MVKTRHAPRLIGALLFLLLVPSAPAVINLDMPLAKIVEAVKAVVIGEVTAVNPENRVVDLKAAESLKGTPIGESFRVQIATPPELITKVAVGQQLVLLTGEDFGKPVALIHVGDTWLLAEFLAASKVPAWRVVQAHQAKKSFAGTTAELVKVLRDLKPAK